MKSQIILNLTQIQPIYKILKFGNNINSLTTLIIFFTAIRTNVTKLKTFYYPFNKSLQKAIEK